MEFQQAPPASPGCLSLPHSVLCSTQAYATSMPHLLSVAVFFLFFFPPWLLCFYFLGTTPALSVVVLTRCSGGRKKRVCVRAAAFVQLLTLPVCAF